ncbi:MAG: type VI secretion system tip protein VgrG [Desulfobacteraceae bacterium]|nr:type VI secretion system tip protein VgrG [Desulfobacteraceae bacterium]
MAFRTAANESRFFFRAGGKQFLVTGFEAWEKISALFEVRLSLASEAEIDFDQVVGKPGLLTIEGMDEARLFHGIVLQFTQSGVKGRFVLYEAVLGPQARLLSLRSDCRIFQELDAPAIVRKVLESAKVPGDLYAFRLQTKYKVRDYCVQYRETDLAFIRRLCAEEGIFFFFEHHEDKHVMVFGDGTVNYQPIAGPEQVCLHHGGGRAADDETIQSFALKHQILPGSHTLRDYCFEKPAMGLECLDKTKDNGKLALYDYPGLYQSLEDGAQAARVRLEQAVMYQAQGRGQSDVARFTPGFTFTLQGYGFQKVDGQYLLVKVSHTGRQPQVLGESGDSSATAWYSNQFEAIPSSVTLRPEPLPKPFVQGSQTAMVTGPAGEEIYTDRYGRVKVQFHWDRQGQSNEKSSCWIRVSQAWAGKGYGAMFIPRIGQEVIVDFLEGDPDRPIITGRVYSGDNRAPYRLPEEKSIAAIKTLSTPGGQGFNELRFEDNKGREQLFMHAQRDLDLRVGNDRRTFVGNDAHLIVQNKLRQQIGGDHHLAVQGDRVEEGRSGRSLTVGKDDQRQISGNYGLNAGSHIHLNSGLNLVVEAGAAVTLKAGAGFITIDDKGVSLNGPKINLNSGGSPLTGQPVNVLAPVAPLVADTSRPGKTELSLASGAGSVPAGSQAMQSVGGPAEPDIEESKRHYSQQFDFSAMIEAGSYSEKPLDFQTVTITKPDGTYLKTLSIDQYGLSNRLFTEKAEAIIAWVGDGEWGIIEEFEKEVDDEA